MPHTDKDLDDLSDLLNDIPVEHDVMTLAHAVLEKNTNAVAEKMKCS